MGDPYENKEKMGKMLHEAVGLTPPESIARISYIMACEKYVDALVGTGAMITPIPEQSVNAEANDIIFRAVAAHRDWSDCADECGCGWNLQDPDNDPDVGEIGHVTWEILKALKEAGLKIVRDE